MDKAGTSEGWVTLNRKNTQMKDKQAVNRKFLPWLLGGQLEHQAPEECTKDTIRASNLDA